MEKYIYICLALACCLCVTALFGDGFTANPDRISDLQIHPLTNDLFQLTWNEVPGTDKYRIYISGSPLATGDPGWLLWQESYIPLCYVPSSPAAAFFYVSAVHDDIGTFKYVPGGTFNNGTANITVSPFYLDKYEVTQDGYQAVMGSNPAYGSGVGASYPVYFVTWFKAIEYCNKRSLQEGFTPCYSYLTFGTNPANWPVGWNDSNANATNISCAWSADGYRLPTEAEWEFAARGGIFSHGYTYSGGNAIDAVAWYTVNAANASHPVGTKAPNELGLYDMSGNIREFVWDISANYPTGDQTDPTGPTTGVFRVRRGGGWWDMANACEVSARYGNTPTTSHQSIGFRVARRTY